MNKTFYYICLFGIPFSFYLMLAPDVNVAEGGTILFFASIVGSIISSPSDSYLKLIFRKTIMNFNSHKEKIKKELEDKWQRETQYTYL